MATSRADLREMECDALPSAMSSMHECAAYTSSLAKFYDASFEHKIVHPSQTKEGLKSLQEAIELVASNITNVSSTLTSYMDCQSIELDCVRTKVALLKHKLAVAKEEALTSAIPAMMPVKASQWMKKTCSGEHSTCLGMWY
ncbi:hypothetical protein ACHHYP_03964 [Achlya hypogyna]|uniref:Uncharacterized protein n=1 Tax=Achlya hypogyna TaxID=1202772 RepID=A0A1V9Z2Z6_ACHHY|nr:hypothetical protein ACHHYP_03964 [Achlya hypogyna]